MTTAGLHSVGVDSTVVMNYVCSVDRTMKLKKKKLLLGTKRFDFISIAHLLSLNIKLNGIRFY